MFCRSDSLVQYIKEERKMVCLSTVRKRFTYMLVGTMLLLIDTFNMILLQMIRFINNTTL